jgi:DNA-directed RNA polymerase specialized sigma24 family protein
MQRGVESSENAGAPLSPVGFHSGSPEAWHRLCSIVTCILRTTEKSIVLDAMADTWARLNAASVSGGPMPNDIVAYCVSAARNRETDEYRRRESPLLSIEGTDVQPLARLCQDPCRLSAGREILACVLERITVLPNLQREAILRVAMLGQTYREIAVGLYGSPPSPRTEGRVNALIHRARVTLVSACGIDCAPFARKSALCLRNQVVT